MTESARPRILGFNHIALEVGDIEEALAFYGRLFKFELRGKNDTMAFIDLGDRFLALHSPHHVVLTECGDRISAAPTQQSIWEGWPSGLRRTLGKRVYG